MHRREDYNNGYALYAIDLTADLGEDGNVRIGMKFAQELAAIVTMIVYAEFENVIKVDRDRNVVFDFGV